MISEPSTLGFGAALLLGLSFGAGACSISCLPYLGPVFLGSGQNAGNSWRILLPFSLGRLSGYTLLAGLAGWAGLLMQSWFQHPAVQWVLGGATILLALALLRRQRKSCSAVGSSQQVAFSSTGEKSMVPGSLFLMGLGMTFNPCAPLTTILMGAAATTSALAGSFIGMGFGLGAVLVPALFFTGIAHLGGQLRQHLSQWRGRLEYLGITLLLFTGVATAAGWVKP